MNESSKVSTNVLINEVCFWKSKTYNTILWMIGCLNLLQIWCVYVCVWASDSVLVSWIEAKYSLNIACILIDFLPSLYLPLNTWRPYFSVTPLRVWKRVREWVKESERLCKRVSDRECMYVCMHYIYAYVRVCMCMYVPFRRSAYFDCICQA